MRSVAVFYLLAFAVSWAIMIPQAAAGRGLINIQLPGAAGFLSPLAPMLAAVPGVQVDEVPSDGEIPADGFKVELADHLLSKRYGSAVRPGQLVARPLRDLSW